MSDQLSENDRKIVAGLEPDAAERMATRLDQMFSLSNANRNTQKDDYAWAFQMHSALTKRSKEGNQ